MRGFIDRLLAGDSPPSPPLPVPVGRKVLLPDSDADAGTDDAISAADEATSGRAFVIGYRDTAGQASERRIVCHGVYDAEGQVYVRARCLERQASRTFRRDRISMVFCGVTGEDLGTADRIFVPTESRAKPRPAVRPRSPLRPALRVLMTLARCDGRIVMAEADAIEAFVSREVGSGGAAETAALMEYAYRLAPDFGRFLDDFATIVETDRDMTLRTLECAVAVMMADGVAVDAEIEACEDLTSLAQAYGMKVSLERYEVS